MEQVTETVAASENTTPATKVRTIHSHKTLDFNQEVIVLREGNDGFELFRGKIEGLQKEAAVVNNSRVSYKHIYTLEDLEYLNFEVGRIMRAKNFKIGV